MGTPITIRRDPALYELSKLTGLSQEDISDRVVNLFTELTRYFCKAHCGQTVRDLRESETKYKTNVLALKALGRTNKDIEHHFEMLIFFDAADDCPLCGCECNESDGFAYCTNCGYDEEPPPDDIHDLSNPN